MRILILINSSKNSSDKDNGVSLKKALENFPNQSSDGQGESSNGQGEFTVEILDMNSKLPQHELFYKIRNFVNGVSAVGNTDPAGSNSQKKSGSDVAIITINCAGFELKNELDGLSLNILTCRMAHIITQPPYKHKEELSNQMNFSMFVYVATQEALDYCRDNLPDVPNIDKLPDIDFYGNQQSMQQWFNEFRGAAMLY